MRFSQKRGVVNLDCFFRIFLLVVLHEMVEHGKRKFRSVRRKKRKGFCGHNGANKRPKLTEKAPADQDGGGEGEARDEIDLSETKDLPVRVNVSASKLHNSSFSSFEEQEGTLTRKKSISVGLRVASADVSQVASVFKLQDATLLSEGIASAVICSSCRKPQLSNSISEIIRRKDLLNVFF